MRFRPLRKPAMNIFRAALAAALACGALQCHAQAYDLVIRNARIVDGTGSPWYLGDVAVKGDTIVRIAPAIAAAATRTIDAKGLVVSPGFIDVHTHAIRG